VSIEEAVLLDDVHSTLAHVENDFARDGLVDADAGEAGGEALSGEAVALQSSNVNFVELVGAGGGYLS
jgi:hypothetical protein